MRGSSGMLDKVAGRLLFHLVGAIVAVVGLGLALTGGRLVIVGPHVGPRLSGLLILAVAVFLGRFAFRCFAPARRLSLDDRP